MTKIKICGLSRLEDIDFVNLARPDYIGFVFAPSRRRVTPEQARKLRGTLRPDIVPVGVFVNESIENILALEDVIDIIQLHGSEDEGYIKTIKSRTDMPVIKAAAVQKTGDARKWQNTEADYLLLDNKGGGTGQTFDWNLIGEGIEKPYFLAGGLNIGNIPDAIRLLAPYCVDVSSGAETEGQKDPDKIERIVRLVRQG